jgi:hypothetical protein
MTGHLSVVFVVPLLVGGCASSTSVEEVTTPDSSPVQALEGKLESMDITLDFANAPFLDVIDYIRKFADINIVVDQDVQDVIAEEDNDVTLVIRNLKLGQSLELLLSLQDLSYEIDKEGVLHIITLERETPSLCDFCGQLEGTDACCPADAPLCSKCGVAKGSAGCCEMFKGEEDRREDRRGRGRFVVEIEPDPESDRMYGRFDRDFWEDKFSSRREDLSKNWYFLMSFAKGEKFRRQMYKQHGKPDRVEKIISWIEEMIEETERWSRRGRR